MFVPHVNFANVEVLTAYFEENDPFVEIKEYPGYVKAIDTETGERAFWTKGSDGFLTFDSSDAISCCSC